MWTSACNASRYFRTNLLRMSLLNIFRNRALFIMYFLRRLQGSIFSIWVVQILSDIVGCSHLHTAGLACLEKGETTSWWKKWLQCSLTELFQFSIVWCIGPLIRSFRSCVFGNDTRVHEAWFGTIIHVFKSSCSVYTFFRIRRVRIQWQLTA